MISVSPPYNESGGGGTACPVVARSTDRIWSVLATVDESTPEDLSFAEADRTARDLPAGLW
ncbi:hypothetical protein IM25_09865 [Rhodococcus sp. p52]|uniref:Uncharacterized protein n=1 Tax=Rhodococcus pyridinivorans AK37 TaxID=1114960 RepID=H0JPY7_9NOCA|nr:hypothetical protein IM25_09865 [Rhodococcus sp. p52]EHK84440.1 hypothetical protein AK37_09032 [Rhodococcus pyridinivorans AK37]KHJ70417.1 hypothetical protein QR64_24150 [Rhodococcus sp. Chr-9]KLL96972.1 hypothetical protein NJ76_08565 [Rhodococcus sp. IITR03]OBA32290.1 hypothetical protein A5767_17585 [Rhodococcus sp. 852002-51564_SCH6189132-a]